MLLNYCQQRYEYQVTRSRGQISSFYKSELRECNMQARLDAMDIENGKTPLEICSDCCMDLVPEACANVRPISYENRHDSECFTNEVYEKCKHTCGLCVE